MATLTGRVGVASWGSTASLADGKTSEAASSLSAKLGSLILTEKEKRGLIFVDTNPTQTRVPKWSAVGKSFSPRHLNRYVLERAMQKAWGLHNVGVKTGRPRGRGS